MNIDLVNAQQARRVLDRIVGFQLSPVLWRKLSPHFRRTCTVGGCTPNCGAERDINNFEATSNYRVTGDFLTTENDETKIIKAGLNKRFNSLEESKSF